MTRPVTSLLSAVRANEPEAIEEFVERFQPEALRLAAALLSDRALAEDAVQEAFVTALEKIDQVQQPDALSAWWRQVVRSQCHRILRKTTATPVEGEVLATIPDPTDSPEQRAERKELRALVRQAVNRLPEIGRAEAELYYFDQRSQAEIAEQLGVPTGTVKRRLHVARKRLRQMFVDGLPSGGIESEGPGW